LGDLEFKENRNLGLEEQMITSYPEVTKHLKREIDFVIVGCDGIWECKKSEEMTGWIRRRLDGGERLGRVLEELLDEIVAKDCQDATGTDNMSAILVKFDRM
jgi:serine/threonine protein phosphatase PrpC